MSNTKVTQVERVFTFGYGHRDTQTGLSLAEKCVIVRAADRRRCRDLMVARYGNQWAFDYDTLADAGYRDWRPMIFGVIDETGFTPALQVGYRVDGVDGPDVWCPVGKEQACSHYQQHRLFRHLPVCTIRLVQNELSKTLELRDDTGVLVAIARKVQGQDLWHISKQGSRGAVEWAEGEFATRDRLHRIGEAWRAGEL